MRMQEASGYAHVNLTAPRGVTVVTRVDAKAAPFAAGLGLRGGTRPQRHRWTWNPSRPLDARKGAPPGMGVEGSVWDQFAWLGSTELGLKLRLLGDQGAGGPQLDWKLAPPYPRYWASGDVGWDTTKDGVVVLRATTGTQPDGVDVAFSLQTSPVRRLTARHMFAEEMRRFHAKQWDPPNCSKLHAEGVRALTLHHGTRLNPYINYPFHDATLYNLGTYAKACAAAGVPVSLYYTHREISSHASELPLAVALLNATDDAPLVHYAQAPPAGRAEGFRKKRQKLEARLGPDTFVAAWGTPIRGEAPHGDENDVAVAVAARGAWTRFWVRGARYLRRCIGVAGFYLDGIAPPPATVAAFRREGGRLDLHAANKTAVYLELYPYLDSVWTGEASYLLGDANHYLVGIAGLPCGRPSQLLAGALRKEPWLYYRALLFGMTERAGWSDTDVSLPRLGALWRTFDAVDVASADVVGFWRRDDARAVMSTACGDVKRTAFVVDGGAMVVVASWSRKTCVVDVSLEGLGDMVLEPNVPGLQCGTPPKKAGANITLTIEPKSGALFVVYGPALASRVAGLAGEGPCTQEKWWWSSPRKRGAHSLRPARRPAALPRRPRSRPARAPPAHKAPKSKEPKPKASLLARVGRLFRGDREAASGEPLGVGAVCYRFCEDGSRPSVSRRADCPAGTACRTTLPPDAAAFDSCGAPETCQKDQSPGPPARVDAAAGQPTGRRVDEALCGFADRAAPRFAPPTAPIARDDATTAEQGMRRLAADFLEALARRRDPRAEPVLRRRRGAGDDRSSRRRRRGLGPGYSEGRKTPPLRAGARELRGGARAARGAARVGAGGLYAESGRLRGHAHVPPTDGCGRRPTGTYAPWQADARRPPPKPGAGPVLSHVACLDSNDVPAPFFHADARAKVATPKRTAACAARFARTVKDGQLGAWDAHARALCEAGASMAPRRRAANATVLFRGGGGRSCWDAAQKDVGRDGAGVCGRSLLFRGAGTEQDAHGRVARRPPEPHPAGAAGGVRRPPVGRGPLWLRRPRQAHLVARADALPPGVLLRRVLYDRGAALGPLRARLVHLRQSRGGDSLGARPPERCCNNQRKCSPRLCRRVALGRGRPRVFRGPPRGDRRPRALRRRGARPARGIRQADADGASRPLLACASIRLCVVNSILFAAGDPPVGLEPVAHDQIGEAPQRSRVRVDVVAPVALGRAGAEAVVLRV